MFYLFLGIQAGSIFKRKKCFCYYHCRDVSTTVNKNVCHNFEFALKRLPTLTPQGIFPLQKKVFLAI